MSTGSDTPGTVPLAATSAQLNLGGSTTFLLNLAAALRQHGIVLPVVVLTEHIELRREFEAVGVELGAISTRRVIYEDRLLWGYRELFRRQPLAVLACIGAESFEMLRLVPRCVLRLGVIQSDDPGPYRTAAAYHASLDAMIGVSQTICRKLRAMPEMSGIPVEYIPYGIRFQAAVPKPPRATDAPIRVVYLGRMAEVQKRISRIAAVIQLLRQRGVPAAFTLMGTGPEEQDFRNAVSGCANVNCLGAVPPHETTAVLREQDVFILLSDFEGLPLSLLEAMGEGVVPVVSDLESGVREVVTDECGIRVPVGDISAAADAIEALQRDRPRLARLSDEAAHVARGQFDAAQMAERYLALVHRLGKDRPAPVWPATVSVGVPLGMEHPWMYRGLPRLLRRFIKRLCP